MNKCYFVFCLAFSVFASAQVINFPDANFKAKLLQSGVAFSEMNDELILDANNDGEIEVSEVQNVYALNVSNANISDLTGISSFSALKFLTCNNNSLTNITIDNSIALMALRANHNNLTSLNLDLSSAVEGVDLSYNNFSSFIIENTYVAENFNLSHNQLTSLTLNNSVFTYFMVDYNFLTSIEYQGNVSFSSGGFASFTHNQFTLLDLSNANFDPSCVLYLGYNPSDNVVFPDGSQPCVSYSSNNATFDMGNYSMVGYSCDPEQQGQIRILNCPNLTNLILKNGYNHTEHECNEGGTVFQNPSLDLTIQSCPNLSYICVDELEQPFVQARINQQGFQNQVQVNSYCSFIPGGEFYTITGNTKFDFNANGCDTSDTVVPNQRFTITNGTETSTIISSDLASYHINVGAGNHTITPIIENPLAFSVSPANLSVNFPAQASPVNQDFCMSSLAPTHDFEITLIPIGVARPGFHANYKIVFKNTGNVIDTGSIVLTYQDTVLDFVSASTSPHTNSSGNLSWLFTNLMPFETRTINVTFNLNGPMETPSLNANDVLSFTSSIAETGATQPFSNNHLLNQTVVNSFDPNDKICLEGQNLSTSALGNYVSYRIRFENTGTFAAENIVVKDMIDSSKFDVSTVTPISGSHDFYTKITANKVEFIFENINLPFDDANNDGYVVFKIKLLPSVIENIPFSNEASIYFDYNFPIITNSATSVIGTLGTPNLDLTNQFTIFPVPAGNVLQIQSNDTIEIRTIEIYNNLGQLVQKELGNQQNIDVSQLTKGSYYLKIKSNDSSYTKTFIKA
jgi:uncharacterized repeat protein (TIGR01451 family)